MIVLIQTGRGSSLEHLWLEMINIYFYEFFHTFRRVNIIDSQSQYCIATQIDILERKVLIWIYFF